MARINLAGSNESARSRQSALKRQRKFVWTSIAILFVLMLSLTAGALQNPQQPQQSGGQERGARNAGVRPKRVPEHRTKDKKQNSQSAATAPQNDGADQAQAISAILATADFDLIGLAITAGPATQTVPKNTPTTVLTSMLVPQGSDPAPIIAGLNPNYRVRGELTGPSLTAPLTVEAPIGQPLPVPALTNAGDHLIRNLRVVDIGAAGQPVVTSVTPDSCGIVVIDRLLISEVHVNELTYDQIMQAGINIDDDAYQFFNFTLGLVTSSDAQQISIPVAFPSIGVTDPRPVVGAPSISGPGTSVPIPDVLPVMLEVLDGDGMPVPPPEMPGGGPMRIPGVVVFPGRIGLLHQFFEAIVIVANGAPGGTPLVVRNLHAKATLPDNGTPGDESDDPLRIAATQVGGRVSDLELHGLGPDGRYGTEDDTENFSPGQSGQGTFLLEGLKEGLHTINFDLEGTLEGLPGGPVRVRGSVPGAVLVRDASFSVTFTHPSVVRAGQEYDLAMTMYNSGSRDIQGAFANLGRNSVSGAELLGISTQRQFPTTIARGSSATVKWRLRANVTGAVTATYVKVGDDVSAGLNLVTGVGDRNVPLSPDSLILPDSVKYLPTEVVEASRELLGQAWSVANAPPGALPPGVVPVNKQTVVDRAVELGVAGLRVNFGEPVNVSLDTLMRDWLGELQTQPDIGFADTMRETVAGNHYYDSLGAQFYKEMVAGKAPLAVHQDFANAESPRSSFISALVTQAGGTPIFGARFVDASGKRVGFGESAVERYGELRDGGSMPLSSIDPNNNPGAALGQMLVVSNPATTNWMLEINGWQTGAVDISLLVPASGRAFRQLTFSNVPVQAGKRYRVVFRPLTSTLPALEEFRDGAFMPTGASATLAATLSEPQPRVVGTYQATPDVIPGGDKYGRLVGLLFSKPMNQESVESLARYRVGGGALVSNPSENVGGPIAVTGAKLNYGDRFVFVSLDGPIGPYIKRDMSVSGVLDAHRYGLAASPSVGAITMRVSPEGVPPGAYLTGRVMSADGTPVPNATVLYFTQECAVAVGATLPPPPKLLATRTTDSQGRYQLDYVRNGDCGPLIIEVNNPITHSNKRLTTPVIFDGQHMVLDIVYLARGNVQGTITSGGLPLAKAFVRVVPELDAIGTKVAQTDEQGHYSVTDIPVGNVSVMAVGSGAASNASGLAAGTINGPGQTATVNVSMQNISGVVRGRVVNRDGSPGVGTLVIAFGRIPGFGSQRLDGMITVGYGYAGRDGSFAISNLPVNQIKLEATDYVTGLVISQPVQLSEANPEVDGILLTLPGYGSISGRVLDEVGQPVPGAFVSGAGRAVRADAQGNYLLESVPAGFTQVSAQNVDTAMGGSATAVVRLGETTPNVNITIYRPASISGHVYKIENGVTVPASKIKVSHDGYHQVQTDNQGAYSIPLVPSNAPLTLRFVDVDKHLFVNINAQLSPNEHLVRDATIRSANIHGRITQPDGVTGTVAPVSLFLPKVYLQEGPYWGMPDSESPYSVQSAPNGNYSFTGLNPGVYRVSTSNEFFPTQVSAGGTLLAGADDECNLSLVSTLAGKIQGTVYQPDGVTTVGPGVQVTIGGGFLANVTARTDSNGHYEFAEVFAESSYEITATDSTTGYTNRVYIAVRKNEDAIADVRLLGTGGVRIHVVDGAGNPVLSGSTTLDGSSYPNFHRFAELTTESGGVILFDNLPEGPYAISGTQNGLGGRVSATIVRGAIVDATVQLQASGTIKGRVFMPGGTVPIGLADVELYLGGRNVGFTVTSDADDDRGSFTFLNVPTGDFSINVLDNRTGRVGRTAGRVTQQGEIVNVSLELLTIGAVTGQVTSNGNPVDHALVRIAADGSGVRSANLQATTDPQGRFRFTGIPAGRFTISVSDAPGGQTGSASGIVSGTVEPLPDTVVNIALEPSVTLTGTVYRLGGAERVNGARVSIIAGGRYFETATNESGVYRLSFVPLGEVRVRAEAPTGYDRGEASPVTASLAGSTVISDVVFNGVANISGAALDNTGTPLNNGTVILVNDGWSGAPVVIGSPVINGRYEFPGAPAGHFSLRLTVPNRVGVGTAAGDLAANQNLELPVRLEDAGGVTGVVKAADGATPIAGVDITLYLSRPAGGLVFYTHTNSQGVWNFENVPLGTISVMAHDIISGGIARSGSAALATNGQTIDVGSMLLDSTPISVVSVEPANGSALLPASGTLVKVTFSEPAESGTVNTGTVQLQQVSAGTVGASVSLSADGLTATLTPTNRLAETATFKVVVSGVEDRAGLRLANTFNSTFTTADETAPTVISIAPANSATEIPVDASIVVNFSEPIDRSSNLADIIKVVASNAPDAPLAGVYSLDPTARIATFIPAGGLSESSAYTVTVNGQRDASGNVQTQPAINTFTTLDRSAPVVDPLPIDGTRIRAYRPTITATYHDNLSGIKTSSVVLKLDNVNVTAGAVVTGSQVTYTPATPLSGGHHNLSVQVSDNANNQSALRTAQFDIDDSGPAITSFTIGGAAAVNGMYVTSSLQPAFALTYTDDTGINVAATQLLLAPQGSPLVQVPATVTTNGITYQPPAYLAEGPYAVQAVITNNLGTSSTTGVINFTLDVDAPEITSVTPATGSQHGGTSVTVTGARLLSTTGAAPIVTIGGNTTQVLSAVAGSPDQLTLITPAGVPGPATIQMSTNRGTGVLVGGFNYQADPRTPFISEPDTILLWHMNELANGSVSINDSGPTRSITGTSDGSSLAQPGRFAGGRANANIYTSANYNSLYFASSGFTVEGWMKTNTVGRTYTIFGKEDNYGYYYGPPEYAVRLMPGGNLRALLYDSSQRQWFADMPASGYRVDDDQWHYVAMVVDRASNRLSVYVDGIERASSAPPAGFGVLYNSGQPFRAGHWAYYEQQTTGGGEPFPGTIDEVRVSSTAHSAAVVQKTYLGTEGALGVSITNTGPANIARGTTSDIDLAGYNLAGATPTINGPAAAQLTAQVVSSSATQARVRVTVAADAALGDAQLVMSSSQGSATLALRVIDLSRSALGVEPDTKLLWHMDETANGGTTIFDAGRFNFNGFSGGSSLAQPGRFNGGRANAVINTSTSIPDLYMGSSSFTVEGWMKTDLVGRTYTIFGKEDFYGGYYGPPEYAVRLLPTGTLRALVYDNSQRQWMAEMPANIYHVDDNQWHSIVMVVDRASNKLSLYVDGIERASSAPPAGFGALYNSGQPFCVGKYAAYDPQTTGGGEAFPGTIDEVRISSTAHTPERILNDLLGNSPMRVTSYSPREILRERAGLPSYVNQLTVNGYNLDGATARLQVNGQTADAVVIVTSSTYRQAIVSVDVAATTPLGDGQLVFSKQGQADAAIDVRVGDQSESAGFTDTVLLWNLNETGNGAIRIFDTGPLGIHGTASNQSLAQPGHYGGGRSKPVIISDNDNGALQFNSSSFTVECWFKTGILGRTYTLVGKEDFFGGYYGPPEYAIRIMPSGGLRALAYDTSQRQWKAEMPASVYELDDNLWHHAAMVVDRANNKLSLYVDGIERASSTMPAGFGAMYNSGQQLRAGKYAVYDEATFGGNEEFPGVLDDIRISASAHTAEQIVANMNGTPGLRVNSYAPQEAPLNKATGETFSTLVTLNGFGLDNVTASLKRNGQPLNATATVESSSFSQAQVRLSIDGSVATGTAQLVLTKPNLPAASVDVRLFEQSEFATNTDTRLLWHLNETGNGAIRALDSGPLGIHGTASNQSLAQPGHLGGGRSKPLVIADFDYGALYFGTASYTAECWFKTGVLGRTYTLVGKEDFFGGYYGPPEYAIRITPSGGIRALAYDTSQRQWKAEVAGRVYDPATGRWQMMLDDNQWHHAAMVVDRASNKLSLYVDGIERASSTMPAGFGAMYNSGQQFRIGKYAIYDEATFGGNEEFPGIIDEVRISSSAHTPAQVLADALGTDTAHISLTQPTSVQRGSTSVALTFTGYGLMGATVTTDQPAVSVTVVSSTSTQLNCLLSVPQGVPVGDLHFAVTDTRGQVFNPSLTIVDQQPFVNDASSNSETLLLWHLDEAGNGGVHVNGSGDALPNVVGGTASVNSQAQAGRFGGGRIKTNVLADTSAALYLGSSSFTVEGWVKTDPLGRTYTIFGKEDFFGGYYGPPEYAIRLTPSGGLRALAYDTSQRQWKAEMPGRLYDAATGNWQININDGQWHYIVMTVDRTNNKMSLYADGVERASATMPAGFGALYNSGQQFRIGKYAIYDEATFGGNEEFPGALDEVRVLNFARTAAQVQDTWLGTHTGGFAATVATAAPDTKITDTAPPVITQPLITVNAITPGLLPRDKTAREALVINIAVEGSNLSGVRARVVRDGQTLAGINARVQDSSDTEAHLALAVAPATPLGMAELVLSKTGYEDASVWIRVVEPGEFALEADTVGLWHMDEREEGAAHLLDSSENAINLSTAQASRVDAGRFGGGRKLTRATADASNNALSFNASNFTVEGWVKSGALERDYVLVGKETGSGQNTDYTLKLTAKGSLRAEIYDTNGALWEAETLDDAGALTDNQWHSVAMVLDRGANLLFLYVDGRGRAIAQAPKDFSLMRNLGQPLEFGCFDADSAGAGGPEEFPGILDEIRISNTAHTRDKIEADFFGHDAPEVTRVQPTVAHREDGATQILLAGYGLAGATVSSNQPDVTVNVVSTSATRITLSINIQATAVPGPLLLTVTDTLKQTTTVEIAIGERRSMREGSSPKGSAPGANRASQQQSRKKTEAPPVSGRVVAPSPPLLPPPVSQSLRVIGGLSWPARAAERLLSNGAGGQR
ncbi:MAG: large repetitive protein [Blastocatellia bacterium]|jgi:hypothetical protein|nr:large repetitive protein [Blastocatellia bacterium]